VPGAAKADSQGKDDREGLEEQGGEEEEEQEGEEEESQDQWTIKNTEYICFVVTPFETSKQQPQPCFVW
jgi:hypothetical protein